MASPWDSEILLDVNIRKEALRRQDIIAQVSSLFERIPEPDMDFGEALKLGLIEEADLVSTYDSLAEFLDEETYAARIILYFPIELLPGKDWRVGNTLARAIERFTAAYLHAWRTLLSKHDLRANFVDGDIPEVEIRTGPLPRVVKAAHLIPALIHKGFISLEDAVRMADETNDSVLHMSIREALHCNARQSVVHKKIVSIPDSLRAAFATFEAVREAHWSAQKTDKRPESRVAWEIATDAASIADECSSAIASAIERRTVSAEELACELEGATNPYSATIVILSFRKVIESVVRADKARARKLCEVFERASETQWQSTNHTIMEALESAWSRIAATGVTDAGRLKVWGINSLHFENDVRIDEETRVIVEGVAHDIKTHKELSSMVMPIAMAFGSRIKGYSARSADRDIAVFIRPGVDMNRRSWIQKLLAEILIQYGIAGKPLEFWLDATSDETLAIRDFTNPDRSLGDSTLTHVFFGSVWAGEAETIRMLYEKVLEPYLKVSPGTKVLGQPARELWLEEIERDMLQYRLMHKGYHRFYPERKTRCIPHGIVDSKGAFWDSGYRRTATILFLKKVFLPHVRQKK
jgi:hypothetical protein